VRTLSHAFAGKKASKVWFPSRERGGGAQRWHGGGIAGGENHTAAWERGKTGERTDLVFNKKRRDLSALKKKKRTKLLEKGGGVKKAPEP